MLVFDATEWQAGKGREKIALSEIHQIEISVSCTQDVQLFGVSEDKTVPLKIGREFRIRCKTKGFLHLELKGKPQVEFGYRIRTIERQDGEPLNSDNPPDPPMPGQDNLLLQMRRIMNENMRRDRPPVLEPEGLGPFGTRYEVDEDDYRFEEDIAFEAQQAREQSEVSDPPEPPPPAAAEPPPEPPEPPSQAQAAE